MVERDVATVRDDTIDEFQFARLEGEARRNACPALSDRRQVSLAIIVSKMFSWWMAMTPRRHPVAPKYFE